MCSCEAGGLVVLAAGVGYNGPGVRAIICWLSGGVHVKRGVRVLTVMLQWIWYDCSSFVRALRGICLPKINIGQRREA